MRTEKLATFGIFLLCIGMAIAATVLKPVAKVLDRVWIWNHPGFCVSVLSIVLYVVLMMLGLFEVETL